MAIGDNFPIPYSDYQVINVSEVRDTGAGDPAWSVTPVARTDKFNTWRTKSNEIIDQVDLRIRADGGHGLSVDLSDYLYVQGTLDVDGIVNLNTATNVHGLTTIDVDTLGLLVKTVLTTGADSSIEIRGARDNSVGDDTAKVLLSNYDLTSDVIQNLGYISARQVNVAGISTGAVIIATYNAGIASDVARFDEAKKTWFYGDLDVLTNTNLQGNLTVGGTTTTLNSLVNIVGNTDVTGTFDVTGDVTFIGIFDVTGDSAIDGTLGVTGNVTAPTFTSNVITGTSPFTVTSTTKVANLNVDLFDDLTSTQFLRSDVNDVFEGTFLDFSHTSVALTFDDQTAPDGKGIRRITCNDGGGNWSFRSGNYFNVDHKYTGTGDGAAHMVFSTDNSAGIFTVKVAPTGTANAAIVWGNQLQLTTTQFYTEKNLVVDGNTTLGNALTDSVTITGLATVGSTLIVEGETTINDAFNVLGLTTTTTLEVTNASDLLGAVTIGDNLDVKDALGTGSLLLVDGTADTVTLHNVAVSTTSDFTGDVTLHGDLLVKNNAETANLFEVDSVTDTITILGDLVVTGTTTTVDATNLNITDNIIVLNNGEVGAGVTEGSAGIEIDRGISPNRSVLWDEASGVWKLDNNTDGFNRILTNNETADVNVSGSWYFAETGAAALGTNGAITIGSITGPNVTFDSNELQSRNNGVASTFYINQDGGNVILGLNTPVVFQLGGSQTISQTLEVTGNTTLTADLAVNGNTTLGNLGTDTITVNGLPTFLNTIQIGNANTVLSKGTADVLSITTSTGYVNIGSQNTSYAHFDTDRADFYFGKEINAATGFRVHNVTPTNTVLTEQSLVISPSSALSASLSLGYIGGTTTTPFIDFNSGTIATDYDARIVASGGTGVSGNGSLGYTALWHNFNNRVRLTSSEDVSLSSTAHALQIGPDNSFNIAFDPNEIMSRNNGGVNLLHLNTEGGSVAVGNAMIAGQSSSLTVRANDNSIASLEAYGSINGTGMLYVGQSETYGGGIIYNGDNTPATVGDIDHITFYRTNAGVYHDVFSYAVDSNTVNFTTIPVVDGTGDSTGTLLASGDISTDHITAKELNAWIKHNFSAVVAPTANDDTTISYRTGSIWRHYTGSQYDTYMCQDSSTGAAIWSLIGTNGQVHADQLDSLDSTDFVRRTINTQNYSFSGGALVYNYTNSTDVDHVYFDDATDKYHFVADGVIGDTGNATVVVKDVEFAGQIAMTYNTATDSLEFTFTG